jgi:anti-sigma factor RsiW
MSDLICGYAGNRDDVLVGYLYDDIDPIERASFDAHLRTCERCRTELADLGGVRRQLGKWAPPEPVFSATSRQRPATSHQSWWSAVPAWAQAVAAVLVLGAAAGLANVDVRYNKDGLTVRTGWSKPANGASGTALGSSDATPAKGDVALKSDAAPWRADLAALEQQLRTEFRAADAQTARSVALLRSAPGRSDVNDAELLRRVTALIDESERRQKNELALRIYNVVRDVNAQRNADLVRINQNLGLIQSNTAVEILKNRESVNYLMRTSLKK